MMWPSMKLITRCFVLSSLLVASAAKAEVYPSRPIKIIVPFGPGGGIDQTARLIGQKLAENLGQSVIIENRPGGNTIIGTDVLVQAPPDGYTLIMHTNNLSANVTLYGKKLRYNAFKDLAPVSLVAKAPHVLVVNPALPVKTLSEFVKHAKSNPGKVTYGSGGSGTVNHLAGEMLKTQANIDMLHVPYKGSGQLMPDLLAGHVNALFAGISTVTTSIRNGQLRPIAVTSTSRFPSLPNVPTFAELGYADYTIDTWRAVFAPGGTSPAIISRLSTEINKILKDPKIKEQLADSIVIGSTPEELQQFFKSDVDATAKLIKKANITID